MAGHKLVAWITLGRGFGVGLVSEEVSPRPPGLCRSTAVSEALV